MSSRSEARGTAVGPRHSVGGPAGLDDVVGDPVQLLAGAGVGRQRDQPVADLRDPEALELAPDRDPRGGRLPRHPVGQQHPHDAVPASLMQPRLHSVPKAPGLVNQDLKFETSSGICQNMRMRAYRRLG